MLGIIGGSGIYSLGKFRERDVNTPYGFAQVYLGRIGRTDCVFIPRHGIDHRYAPHRIPYRANAWALREMGAEGVLATYACGIVSKFKPMDLVAAEDFIGLFTPVTFYEDFRAGIRHTDFSEPFAKGMQMKLVSAAREAGVKIRTGGVVGTTAGPRYESRAEIRALAGMGANLVSMTNAYEAVLLNELEIPLAGLCIAANYACGVSRRKVSHSDVTDAMAAREKDVNAIIREFAALV